MHWESIGNSENDNHCLNFKSNYDKMKITSIKVNLIKYFFMRNWVLKTLYSRGFTSIEVVFHCNGCIAFSGKFFSGGTSKEVRPLERGDSPRMSRRLRPVKWCHKIIERSPCVNHRSITSKFVTPIAPSCIDNSWRSTTLPAADSASSKKNSDNWIICCQKFSSDVLISSKVSFFMWLTKVLMICK